jgi:catechol 2,3-dioxygenase-like lactoylglutathione lyase family enzyme
MTQASFNIRSFDHVTIIISDLAATRNFYVNLLGMTEVPRPDFDFEGAWFAADPSANRADIHATMTSELAGIAGWGDLKAKSISRGHHFAFQVDDAFACEENLRNAGVEIAVSCRPRPDGPIQMYVHDPDGHVVELFSFGK